MADHRFQVSLHTVSSLPENDVVNVLYFETNAPDTIEGTCDGIMGAYQDLNGVLSADLSGKMDIKVYDLAGGQPIFAKHYELSFTPGAGSGPAEVACCLSYATVDDPDTSSPRRRGRIYIGPFTGAQLAADRPSSVLLGHILDMGTDLAAIGTASNTTWKMFSQTDQVTAKIESIWVDNAWDTQRRRGLDPTVRTVRDVQ